MQEADPLFWENFPDRFKKDKGSKDVGLHNGTGIFNGSIHMGFSSEIDDGIYAFVDQFLYSCGIGNVPSDEMVTGGMRNIGKVFQISGVGQSIHIDQGIIRVGSQKITDEVTSDEPTATCH